MFRGSGTQLDLFVGEPELGRLRRPSKVPVVHNRRRRLFA
jgi:hypothetical protein